MVLVIGGGAAGVATAWRVHACTSQSVFRRADAAVVAVGETRRQALEVMVALSLDEEAVPEEALARQVKLVF